MKFLLSACFFILALGSYAQDVTKHEGLRMETITAYNLVVDSNIESPAGKSPSAAYLGVKVYNDSATELTNVVVNIGKLTDPGTSAGTPGVFESRTVTVSGANGYSGTFALQAPGGGADCTRIIPSIAPGEYAVQYFFIKYPLLDGDISRNSVTGAASDPLDDLWLNYDIWAYATEGAATRRVNETTRVTMRNEISAMANKIWPNTDSKVPDKYLTAIEATLGWRPEAGNTRVPGAVVMEGIWYDFGNVGAGFDNDGDGLPDRNAWMQPVGDPTKFSPLAARLVKCYGIVIVKLNDGTEKLIPFEDQLYFENLPANNTGAVGLVFYEFLPLDLSKPSLLSPYQEVASGYDNEKFNADYGASVGSVSGTPPLVTFDKSGPATIVGGANATYILSATNNEPSGSTNVFGWPELSLPLVFQDTIPTGLIYVPGSATTGTNGKTFIVNWSTNGGTSWQTTEPAANVTTIRWIMNGSLAAGESTAVSFEATVPSNYTGSAVSNTACLKTGTETNFACDTTTTRITGINSLGDLVWRDDDRNGSQNNGELGIPNISVSLYIDTNSSGGLDSGDSLYATTTTGTDGAYLFSNLPDRKYIAVVNSTDSDIPSGYTLKVDRPNFFAVDLDSGGTNGSAVTFLDADWPFIKALEVTKTVSPTTYSGGELITYNVHLDNHTNTLTIPQPNVQTVYATTTAFKQSNATASTTQAQAAGAPNNVFTFLDWNANADQLQTTGVTPSFTLPSGAGITKVELIIRSYVTIPLSAKLELDIQIGHSDRSIATFVTKNNVELNALVGVAQDFVIDVTSASGVTAGWTAAEINSLSAYLISAKNNTQGSANGDYYIDSIGFRVTTNNTPFAGSYSSTNTIVEWPLRDTYDPNQLEFVSASVMPDVTSTPGTLEWYNLGPVNPGARKTITVTFRAKSPTDTNADGKRDPMTAINTVTTQNSSVGEVPLFAIGLPAGHDDGTVNVIINPAGRIGDTVYWEQNGNNAYNAGIDIPLRGVIVQLFQNGVYTGRSQVTDANGFYEFTSLADTSLATGTYEVRITTDITSDLYTLPWTTFPFSSTQRAGAVTNTTFSSNTTGSYVAGDSVTINNSDSVLANDTDFNQNFGFSTTAASSISGTLFRDWNGNGIQDPGDEPLVGYTLTLTGGATATTDATGFYRFTNITATGNKTVTVSAPPANHTQTLDLDLLPPGTLGGDNATTISPFALGTSYRFIDFAYKPTGSLTIGDKVYYDWNGNRSQDPGEGGIPDITVYLYEDSNGDGIIQAATDALIASDITDSTGFYQFTDLATGNYIVQVDSADAQFPPHHIQTQDLDGLYDDRAKVNLTVSLDTADFGYQPTGTGSIGNLVWLDADNDGIKDASESGINGVIVELYHSSQTPGVHAPAATTTTSGGGFYLFENLADDGYYVYIRTSNFETGGALLNIPLSSTITITTSQTVSNKVDGDDNGIQSAISTAVVSPLITLSADETNTTLDFGFTGVGSVGDFVFYDSNGNGSQDFSETGIADVTVKIFLGNDASGTLVATTTTATGSGSDPAGFYRFNNLPPGTYYVQVDELDAQLTGFTYTADPDLDGVPVAPSYTGEHADSSVIVTSGSAYSGADFGYKPPGAIGDFVWLDLDQDGLQDSGEPGIAGVALQIVQGGTTYNVTTDFDGYWSKIVADGTWTVTVLPSNFLSGGALENRATTYDADGIGTANVTTLILTSGVVTSPLVAQGNLGIDFGYKLNGTYSLSGTIAIHDTGVVGTADDVDDFYDDGADMDAGVLDEVELPGVEVFLFTSGGDFLGSTFTNADGDYSFTGLASGGYKVIIGTTAAPLNNSTLTTTDGNYLSGITVSSTPTSVTQSLTISTSSVVNVDFTFNSTVNYDFGDLPSNYSSTTLAHDGARHIIPGGGSALYLGITAPDADVNGLPSSLANGDDRFGSDDEDGVVPITPANWSNGTVADTKGGSIQVTVTGSGWLVGWIDWNHDGDLLDPGELIVSKAVSAGASTITFDIPPTDPDPDGAGPLVPLPTIGSTSESWLSRFRVFTAEPAFPIFSYEGEATNGEVEDHLIERPVAGSIGDIVWSDLDADGARDANEEGIGGLTVQAFDGTTTLTQTTGTGLTDVDGDGVIDPVGYYRFRGLAAATYTITVTTPPVGYTRSYDENGIITPNVTSVILAADVQYTSADFGYAPKLADISGQVRYDTDSDGEPLDSDTGALAVKIQLWTDPNGDGDPSDGVQVRETYTNASGNYLFADVPTGNYVVVEINPVGTTSTYDVASPNNDRIPVVMVGDNISGRDFLDTQPSLYSIAGTVYEDAPPGTNNTIDELLDTKLSGITVKLYFDRDGNGLVNAGDPELASTTTNGSGDYSFTGLSAGNYVVQKINPSGGTIINEWDASADLVLTDSQIAVALSSNVTTRDFLIDRYLGAITGSVTADTDANNIGDLALQGVTLKLLNSDGTDYDSDANPLNGIQLLTTTTAADGIYSFTDLSPGTYGVAEIQPASYTSLSDKDGLPNLDEIRNILVTATEPNTGNNFVEISNCPDTWADWKQLHPDQTPNGNPAGNPDNDAYANFTEFAFAMPYDNGVGSKWLGHTAWIVRESTVAPDTLEGVFIRPKGAYLNVTYTLQYKATTDAAVWSTLEITQAMINSGVVAIVDNGDCTETVIIRDLETRTGLKAGTGVVRIQADLDDDGGGGVPDLTRYVETEGWTRTDLAGSCQTYNIPYVRESVFTGTVSSVSVQNLIFDNQNLTSLLGSGSYYLEVTSGDHEGLRYDISTTSGTAATLLEDIDIYSGAPHNNTAGAPPSTLALDTVAIRRHWTLGEVLPATDFTASDVPETADQVQIFANGAWIIYWVNDHVEGKRWVLMNDGSLANQAGAVIPPGYGMFVTRRGTGTTEVLSYGEIRTNQFIRPLKQGSNLMGGGYPVDQSPVGTGSRAMTRGNSGEGFFGSRDFKYADSIFVWKGDATPNTTLYETYYLLYATSIDQWVRQGDVNVADKGASPFMLDDRAVFIRSKENLPTYTIPSPWTP